LAGVVLCFAMLFPILSDVRPGSIAPHSE